MRGLEFSEQIKTGGIRYYRQAIFGIEPGISNPIGLWNMSRACIDLAERDLGVVTVDPDNDQPGYDFAFYRRQGVDERLLFGVFGKLYENEYFGADADLYFEPEQIKNVVSFAISQVEQELTSTAP